MRAEASPGRDGQAAVADRALGAYLGLALGDALGATVEFMTPREIAARFGVHRRIVGGGWLKLEPGAVTDDTTMSLALGDGILAGADAGRFGDLEQVARAFVAWWRGRPVDCGNTCRRGIQRYLRDGSLCGPVDDAAGGNGALMRMLPAALATLGDDAAFERLALGQARFTHNHPLSDAAVLGIGHLLRDVLAGADASAQARRIEDFVAAQPAFTFRPYPGRASGYVVDTVQTVLHCVSSHTDFEAAVIAAVNQGDDADTTGALVGMLAGARCGALALPGRWLGRLSRTVVRDITDQASALVALSLDRQSLPLTS